MDLAARHERVRAVTKGTNQVFDATLIFRRRNELGLSLRDVAARVGVSDRSISNLENEITGHRRMTLDLICKLADVLSIPLRDFFTSDTDIGSDPQPDDVRLECALLIARNVVTRAHIAVVFGWTLEYTEAVADQLEARLQRTGCRLSRVTGYRLVPATSVLTRQQTYKAGQAGTRKRGPSVDMARMLRELIEYGDHAGSLQRSGGYQRVVVGRLINCGFVLDGSRAKRVSGDVLFSVGLTGETKGIATAALVAAEASRVPRSES